MTMVERVARAIHEKYVTSAAGFAGSATWDGLSEREKEFGRGLARAAIEAMRDIDSGSPRCLHEGRMVLYGCSEDPELEDARSCFHAIIDAALTEET